MKRKILLSVVLFFSTFVKLSAQQPPKPVSQPIEIEGQRPENVKLIDEYSDGKGNLIRIVQFSQGKMRVRQTIITPLRASTNVRIPFSVDTIKSNELKIVILKSEYCLRLMYRNKILRSYKAVFGPQPLHNKLMEGDRCTPEGNFTINDKRTSSKYQKFLALNYPTEESKRIFNEAKASGKIPATAAIGGSIGIHGIWKGGDDLIELGVGWTDGCIALKNKDIEELFSYIGVGTKVLVKK